jgi:hypothetical protein
VYHIAVRSTAGRFTSAFVLLAALTLAGCGGSDLTLPTPGPGAPADIQMVRGDNQIGAPGAPLPDSVVIKVVDSEGNPLAGQQVEFVPDAPGATVAPETAITGADGRAGARWVLGQPPGTQQVVARVVGEGVPDNLQVVFHSTAIESPAPPPPGLALRTQPSSSAKVGEDLKRQPVIQLRGDGNDLRTSGVPVTAAIASGAGSLAGTTTVLTDGNGRAKFTDLRIVGAGGQHTLIFAANGYTSVTADPIDVREDNSGGGGGGGGGGGSPAASDDDFTVDEGSDQTWHFDAPGVLANDQASGGSAELVGGASNGSVTLHADGSFDYRPGPDYFGPDGFTYRIRTGSGSSNTATVRITVRPVNDSPQFDLPANPDQIVSAGAGPQTIGGFIGNARVSPSNGSENNQTGTFIVTTDNDGLFSAGPSISYPDGTLTYTPSGQTGSATVTVVLEDNGGTANGGSDTSQPHSFTLTVF